MNPKENAQPRNAELSAHSNGVNRITAKAMTPRQSRVLTALQKTTGWISRENIDRIGGVSNGPDLIDQLRKRFGNDAIQMERFHTIDRDGKPTRPGRYHLTKIGRQRIEQMQAVAALYNKPAPQQLNLFKGGTHG